MLDYLRQVFGDELSIESYELKKYPGYISYYYSGNIVNWNQNKCVVISSKVGNINLQTLKKQFAKVQEKCEYPCALAMKNLTAAQRRNLIENRIPFVAAPNQVYFPFWGCAFSEKYSSGYESPKKMTATTQLVFLTLFYRLLSEKERSSQAEITRTIGVTKSSCSRAISNLKEYGLIREVSEGRNKWIYFAADKAVVINKTLKYMQSPIARKLYLKEGSVLPAHKLGGIRALSSQTMVAANSQDGSIVFNKKTAEDISGSVVMSEQEFLDFGGIAAEVWKYDPGLLSEGELVDDISLLICLQDNIDERIQSALDEIRDRYGITEGENK